MTILTQNLLHVNRESIKIFINKINLSESRIQFQHGIGSNITGAWAESLSESLFLRMDKAQSNGEGVYLIPNKTTSRKQNDVLDYSNLFFDIDLKDNPTYKSGADISNVLIKYASSNSCPIRFNCIVNSVGGPHGYIQVTDLSKTSYKDVWSAIANIIRFDTGLVLDRAVSTPNHPIRLPGSFHNKDINNPVEVTLVTFNNQPMVKDEIFKSLVLRFIPSENSSKNSPLKKTNNNNKSNTPISPSPISISQYISYIQDNIIHDIEYNKIRDKYIFKSNQDLFLYINSLDMNDMFDLGASKSVKCIFHEDRKESAVVYRGADDNSWLYYCHSSNCAMHGRALNNIQIICKLCNVSVSDFVKQLCSVVKIFTGNEEYYCEINKLIGNQNTWFDLNGADYPAINKLLKKNKSTIHDLIKYQIDKSQPVELYYKGKALTFLSNRYFGSIIGKDKGTANRLFNLLGQLGLIQKVFIEDVPTSFAETSKELAQQFIGHNEISYYVMPEYNEQTLKQAEAIARKLINCTVTVSTLSCKTIVNNLGIEAAKRTYVIDDDVKCMFYNQDTGEEFFFITQGKAMFPVVFDDFKTKELSAEFDKERYLRAGPK